MFYCLITLLPLINALTYIQISDIEGKECYIYIYIYMFRIHGISACGMWRARAGVQVSRRELHTHIHLD